MAGVQLPEIKRNQEAPTPASAGRIESKFPDTSNETAQMTEGLSKLGNTAFGIAEKYELDAIDDEKLKAKIAYSDWYKRKIEGDSRTGELGLQHQQGDPTEAYNAFDKEATEKFDEILNNPNLSGRARAGVETGLLEAYNSLHSNRLVTYGNQHARYQAQLTESAVNLEVDGAISAMQFVDASDPKSFALFEEKLNGIRKTITNYGFKSNAVVDAEDGDVKHIDGDGQLRHLKMAPALKDSMKKSFSKAAGSAVEVLIDSKKLPEAKYAMEHYKGYIDGATYGKLAKQLQEKEVGIAADMHLAQIGNKSEGEQRAYLNKLSKKTPQDMEIYKKLRDEIHDNQVKKDAALDRQSKNIGDIITKHVLQKKADGGGYASVNDMMKDSINGVPIEKFVKGIEDDGVLKGIHSLVSERPKESDQGALTKMNELYAQKDGLRYKTAQEMSVLTANLKESDANVFWNFWRSVNNETPSEESAKMSRIVDIATSQFKAAKLYEKSYGGVTENSEAHLNDFLTRLRLRADVVRAGASEKELNEWVAENMAQEVLKVNQGGKKKNRFMKWKDGDRPDFIAPKGAPVRSEAPAKPKAKSFDELDSKSREERYREFEKKFKKKPTFKEVQEWIPEE